MKGDWNRSNVMVMSLLHIVGMDGDLIVSSHQVYLGEKGTIERLVRVVMDTTDGVAVGDGLGVQSYVVAA
jgi:hypothetical protein